MVGIREGVYGCIECSLGAGPLHGEFLSQRESAADAERLGCNFQPRRRLLALVFVPVDLPGNAANQLERKAIVLRDFFGAAQILHIGFQDAVEHVVRRKAVLIGLIGAEFGGGSLRKNRFRNSLRARLANSKVRRPSFWEHRK